MTVGLPFPDELRTIGRPDELRDPAASWRASRPSPGILAGLPSAMFDRERLITGTR